MSRLAKPSMNARESASSEMSFEIHGSNANLWPFAGQGFHETRNGPLPWNPAP